MSLLFIDINADEFNMSVINTDNPEFLHTPAVSLSVPALVSFLDKGDDFFKKDPSFVSIDLDQKTYPCVVGIETGLTNTVRLKSIFEVEKHGEKGKVALLALINYTLKKARLAHLADSPFALVTVCIHCRKQEAVLDSTSNTFSSNQDSLLSFLRQFISAEHFQCRPSERLLSQSLRFGPSNFENLQDIGGVFAEINKDDLVIYATKPDSFDVDHQSIARISEISIRSTLGALKEQIHNKTGLVNIPLGERALLKTLSTGYIGTQNSGLYVDLREEVNTILNQLANDIAKAMVNYGSTCEQIFGGLFFMGFLSDMLADKVAESIEAYEAQRSGVKYSVTYLSSNPYLFVEQAASELVRDALEEIQLEQSPIDNQLEEPVSPDTPSVNTNNTHDDTTDSEHNSAQSTYSE